MSDPTIRVLSLGAGVQSTTLLLLAAEGRLPRLDAAIFSDTGWEPRAVYDHLQRLEDEVAKPAGIPILRVSAGNLRDDYLNPEVESASIPLFVKGANGSQGMLRRDCTRRYKVSPIQRQIKLLLGAEREEDGRIGRVPKGRYAEMWIGISMDEWHRAKDSRVRYIRHTFPFLDAIQMDRAACLRYLERIGWADTPKSACIGCPFHGNRMWRQLRDESPDEWADAVAFDAAIRRGSAKAVAAGKPLRGEGYLHASRVPLSEAPIDLVTRREWMEGQPALFDLYTQEEELAGCSPFACRADGLPDQPWAGDDSAQFVDDDEDDEGEEEQEMTETTQPLFDGGAA